MITAESEIHSRLQAHALTTAHLDVGDYVIAQ